ncbi:MAG: DUF4230 domain-containing protein [Phycisphaerales bacterium]
MTKLLLSVLALIVLAGGLLGLNPGGRRDHLVSPISRPEQVLLSRITELAELVTLRVPVSTVITTELSGYTGSISCVVVVHGEVELGVDLEQARFEDVDPEARTAPLVLPPPTVHAARLNHERTRVYSLDRHGLWWLYISDEPGRRVVNRGMQQAQAVVEAAGQDAILLNQAREQAERILREAFKTIGWDPQLEWAP